MGHCRTMNATLCSCSYPVLPDKPHGRPLASRNSLTRVPGWRRREQRRVIRAMVGPEHLADALAPFVDHAILAYERVVFPCQSMNCGDVVYRRFVSWFTPDRSGGGRGVLKPVLGLATLAVSGRIACPSNFLYLKGW